MRFELIVYFCAIQKWKKKTQYQTLAQLHERRKQAVQLHKKGIKIMQIVGMTGLSYPTARHVIDLCRQGGWAAIRPADRGREQGQGRLLTSEQENLINRDIIDKRPEQMKMDFYLWSRTAVMQLIEQECGIKLSLLTVGTYLKRWGFT
jgi:transposase